MWWDVFRNASEGWLSATDIRGDALKSLRTADNELSIFVLDQIGPAELDRMFAAYAAQRVEPDALDFAILDEADIEALNLKLSNELGVTPDALVNSWHRNISELSAGKIHDLAVCLQAKAVFCRRRKKDVIRLVKKALDAGYIDQALVKPKILAKVTSNVE